MGEITIDWEEGTYTGEVSNNVPNGEGTYTFDDGDKYVGEFKDGLPNGQGSYTYPDGAKYVGEWKDDNPWNGTEYDKDGNVTATWSEGVRTEK